MALLVLAVIGFALLVASPSAQALRLGILAPRGELEATTRWHELGVELSQRLGEAVEIVPLPPPQVVPAALGRAIDAVFSHPAHTLELIERLGARPLATLNGAQGSRFAGVIVVRRDSGIRRATDLKGKTVLTLAKSAAGGYLFQAYHLKRRGVDVERDCQLREGRQQDDLVLALRAGLGDAAFVRSGVLESLAKSGQIRMEEFEIVDARHDPGFEYVHTTELYPEWYVSALPSALEAGRAARLKAALLALDPKGRAAQAAGIRGFVEPLPLDGMRALLRAMKMPPFDK
jgi:ABC-type phosphate/phosphonate transport system substrate-binding protein